MYILIVSYLIVAWAYDKTVATSVTQSNAVFTQEFTSKERCLNASAETAKIAPRGLKMVCVPK